MGRPCDLYFGFFFFQAEDGIRDDLVTGVQTCALPILISNQDGLGTSSFPQADFDAPQNKMLGVFEENGITFNKIFICPHLSSKNCGCRKPKIGLVKKFLRDNKIDKNNSFVFGDRSTDKLLARDIGIKFISMQTNGDFYKALMEGGVIV